MFPPLWIFLFTLTTTFLVLASALCYSWCEWSASTLLLCCVSPGDPNQTWNLFPTMWPPLRWLTAAGCSHSPLFVPQPFLSSPLLLFILPPADEKQSDQTKVKLSFSAPLSFITTQAVFWNERSNWQVLKWNFCVRRWHFTSEELSCPAPPAGGWLRVLTLSSLVRFLGCEASRNGQDVFFTPTRTRQRGSLLSQNSKV